MELTAFVFSVTLSLVTAAAADTSDHMHFRAIAALKGETAAGNITFTQHPSGQVTVEGIILGLPHGKYGFHVHEKGDISGGCASAGAHYNPFNKTHGAPEDTERHVGDLGNIEFDADRIARVFINDKRISLLGPNSIIGRTLMVHSGQDDLGKSDHPDSKTTGNAGGRVACGVIGILEPVAWNQARSSIDASVWSLTAGALIAIFLSR